MSTPTVADLFGPSIPRLETAQLFSPDDLDRTASMASAQDPAEVQGLVASLLETAKDRLLDISLVDVLLGGWVKLRALQKYATGDKLVSDKTHEHTLSEHRVSSKHKPHVQLYVYEQLVCDVPLELELALVPARSKLLIRKGRIIGVKLSGCVASASLSCHGKELLSEKSEEIDFPAEIKLGRGVAIPPPIKLVPGAG
ncbi:MAG: hypothetical protein P8008_07705 [Gammaproteobacteria bacterium]